MTRFAEIDRRERDLRVYEELQQIAWNNRFLLPWYRFIQRWKLGGAIEHYETEIWRIRGELTNLKQYL